MTTPMTTTPFPSRRTFSPRTEQTIEVLVFLFLIVPSMLLSLFLTQQSGVGFLVVALSTIFRDLGLVALIVFFLWRNGEPLRQIGWTSRAAWKEFLIGLVLFVPSFFFTSFLNQALRAAGLSAPSAPPSFLTPAGGPQFVLAVILVVIVAVAEETIFRGYLVLRFENVTRIPLVSIFLSAIVFALGHGYEGSAGVLTVGVMGLIFAFVYRWRHSLVAPITMHFLQDFLGIVLLPLLGMR